MTNRISGSREKILLKFLDVPIQIKLLDNMLMKKIKKTYPAKMAGQVR